MAAVPVTAGLMHGMGSEEPPLGFTLPASEADLDGVTKQAVTAFAGGDPENCVFSGPDLEICIWRMAGTLYAPGTGPDDSEGVNLVCELPLDGSPGGRCSTHARSLSHLPPVSAGASVVPGIDPDASVRAAARLGGARTVRELSELVGDAPQACLTGYQMQTCAWHLSADAPSREIFAGVADGAPLEIRCKLPLDGSEREFESCTMVSLGIQ